MMFTGYNPNRERFRELEASAVPFTLRASDYTAPPEIDPRGKVRHDQQGSMGSCQGHSLANVCEYLRLIAKGEQRYSDEKQFSRLFAYLESQRIDGLLGSDRGSTISGGTRVAETIGLCSEDLLPYRTPYPRNARTLVTDQMRAAAEPFRVRSHSVLRSYRECFDYLASGVGGINIGTAWNNSFYARDGVLERVSIGRRDGGHATALLGYSTRTDREGRHYLWRLNSHQDDWTEIAPSVMDHLFGHQWTAAVGMSDLSTPKPRVIDFSKDSVFA